MPNLRQIATDLRLILGFYALLLIIAAVILPLSLSEILVLAGTTQHSWSAVLKWVAAAPGAAPVFYLTQWPFVAVFGSSNLAARLPSVAFGICSAWQMLRVARRVPLQGPYLALLLLMFVPVQFRFASSGLANEEALFFLLLAVEWFCRLVDSPTVILSAAYAGSLTLCLYTEPFSFLPAIGLLLFLIAFINKGPVRRTLWHLLPATALPAILFTPFYLWAHPLVAHSWLFGSERFLLGPDSAVGVFRSLSAPGLTGYILSALLVVGALAGAWRGLRLPEPVLLKRVKLFSIFGGAVSTIAMTLILDSASGGMFSASQVFWAVPFLVILTVATIDWVEITKRMPLAGRAIAALVIAVSFAADLEYCCLTPTENVREQAVLIKPELAGDACVVFVSEGLSKAIFTVFEPDLARRECANFFHRRVVLASHPWVRPDQQADAESYFRGLDFVERKRVKSGGGQIVVMDQR